MRGLAEVSVAWSRALALAASALLVLSAAVAAPAAPAPTTAAPALVAQAPTPDVPLTVTADRIEYNSRTRIVRADGHVRASSGDAVITADHLEGNAETQEIVASGHITLTQGETSATGSFLRYNLATKAGRIEDVAGQFGLWHVSGGAIEVAPGQDVAEEASITPCDPDHPLYKVTARKIVIVPNNYFTAYDASLWVAGVRVITLPVYTAVLGRRSGPSLGYNSLDGLYLEYTDSFPVGGRRDEYRIRLAAATGLSVENILSERVTDHVWSVHLGRSQITDTSSNLVNLDRYSLDLEYDRGRIPEAPIDIQFEAHAGSYAELATRVTATRTEGLVTFATDTFRLGPGLSASAGGLVRVDAYGTGQQRTVLEESAALSSTLSPWASATLSYSGVAVNGATPFSFDRIAVSSSVSLTYTYVFGGFVQSASANLSYDFLAMQTTLGLNVSMSIDPNTAFGISTQYNLTTQQVTEIDFALNVRCDCVTVGLVYRTFPQSPSANNLMIAVGLNAFPGSNVTF